MVRPVSRALDLMHLGRDRVICSWVVDGVVVDPGPASCLDALVAGLGGEEPRALLLTHVHLDHAGAAGVLVRRYPDLRVYVHERGAPHVIDPSRLLASAERLYGEQMERLWGEVAPVPEENVTALSGGENVEGFGVTYAPGHASHHVVYLHEQSGDAFVGDVAGVCIPPSDFTVAPTPPPDIDLDAWRCSLDELEALGPRALCLTHFGRRGDVGAQLNAIRERLGSWGELARTGDREAFVASVREQIRAAVQGIDASAAEAYEQAAPADQVWAGLERYWRKREEAAA